MVIMKLFVVLTLLVVLPHIVFATHGDAAADDAMNRARLMFICLDICSNKLLFLVSYVG